MTPLEKLNIGIIGLGHWGPNLVRNFATNSRCNIKYVCDLKKSNFSRVEALIPIDCLKTTQAKELIQSSEVNTVVVASSAASHYMLVKMSLNAGKHVFCEKPLTLNPEQDKELYELANNLQLKLMVGYTFLFNKAINKLKTMITQNRLGQLYYMSSTRTHMGLVREDISAIWDLAPHDVAIMNYLLDSIPERVSAVASSPLGLKNPDVSFINLFYPNGLIGQIHVSWVDSNKERALRVIGSKARATFNDLDALEPIRLFEKGIFKDSNDQVNYGEFKFLLRDGDIISPKIQLHEPLKMIVSSFVSVILDEAKNITDGFFAYNISKTILAAHKSIENCGSPEEIKSS
jgi:predicted dehydrogenase